MRGKVWQAEFFAALQSGNRFVCGKFKSNFALFPARNTFNSQFFLPLELGLVVIPLISPKRNDRHPAKVSGWVPFFLIISLFAKSGAGPVPRVHYCRDPALLRPHPRDVLQRGEDGGGVPPRAAGSAGQGQGSGDAQVREAAF